MLDFMYSQIIKMNFILKIFAIKHYFNRTFCFYRLEVSEVTIQYNIKGTQQDREKCRQRFRIFGFLEERTWMSSVGEGCLALLLEQNVASIIYGADLMDFNVDGTGNFHSGSTELTFSLKSAYEDFHDRVFQSLPRHGQFLMY